MILYYFKSALRNLKANKKFTFINIVGFGFAISVCMAIALFLIHEYSYDRYHKDANQIVRLIDSKNNLSSIDYRVKDILLGKFPDIKKGCLVQRLNRSVEVKAGDKGFYLDDIMSVDNQFFEIFSIPSASGNSLKPFENDNSAVITETQAKKLFGIENPIGKDLLIWGHIPVTITAIIRDFPDNSSISAGLLVNAENNKFKFSFSCKNSDDLSSYRWPFQIYFQLAKNVSPELLARNINLNSQLLKPYNEKINFLPLKDIYLHDTTKWTALKQGNEGLLKLLSGIAIIILVLAIINYINLTIAQQYKRTKYTGIGKTIGANRKNIFLSYLVESIVIIVTSFLLGIVLLIIGLPFYHKVFDIELNCDILFRFPNLIYLLSSILIIGLISGCMPSMVLSNVDPVKILKGSVILSGKRNYLRNSLTIFQFTVSMVLIFCVIMVGRQIKFVKHRNLGFNQELLLRLDVPNIQKQDIQKAMALLDEFRRFPYIRNVSVSNGVPGEVTTKMGTNIQNSDKNININCLVADTAFIRTFGLKVLKGRDLLPGDYGKVCMINETAFRHFEFDNLDNKRINNYRRGGFEVIGVVNDFHFNSLHQVIEPLCIIFTDGAPDAINIRFASNKVGPGMDYVTKKWQEILPGYPLKYQFYDQWFDSMYHSEERFAQTIGLFAVLAIVISCIGILGLALFSSERRIKEIGIRKINGASTQEVMTMLNKEFVKWVVIAFIITIPIDYYVMNKWLENFAYKATLSWWIFVLSGLIGLGIALFAISWQSWKAATRNPVEALRYE
jgi:putative ABC transport system permease protein